MTFLSSQLNDLEALIIIQNNYVIGSDKNNKSKMIKTKQTIFRVTLKRKVKLQTEQQIYKIRQHCCSLLF